jgi:hypothetical protein
VSETISQLPLASEANLTDRIPATQGSVGAGTGTTRAVTGTMLVNLVSDNLTNIIVEPTAPSTSTDNPNINSIRSATQTGGTPGFVVANGRFFTTVSAGATNYEWALLSVMENHSTAGNNLAGYFQAHKRSTGPTWAATFEADDFNNAVSSVAGSMVAVEIDCNSSNTDDFQNGIRVGIDLICGQAAGTSTVAEIGFGARVNVTPGGNSVRRAFSVLGLYNQAAFDASLGTAGSRSGVTAAAFRSATGQIWDFSGTSTNYLWLNPSGPTLQYVAGGNTLLTMTGAGQLGTVTVTASPTSTEVGYSVLGTTGAVGFDTSAATLSAAAIRLAAGQTIALDVGAAHTLRYDSGTGKLFYAVSGTNVFSVDASGNMRCAGTVTPSVTP